MTRRDLGWRLSGLALLVAAASACASLADSPFSVLLFPLALAALPLIIYGKRVGQIIRAERRGHPHTAESIHVSRLRRRGQNTDGFGT